MHRIDTDGSDGTFTDGNPALGQAGTRLDAAYFMDLQENLMEVLEHAGIAPVKGDYSQLLAAVLAIATGVGGGGGGAGAGAVPTTRQVLGGGLVTGGHGLDQDVTLTVAKASAAEVLAGTRDDAAVTPLALAGTFTNTSIGNSHAAKLPGGLIIQGGGLDQFSAEGITDVPLAIPFATTNYRVAFAGQNGTASTTRDAWPQIVSKRVDGFVCMVQWTGNNGTAGNLDGIDYIAMGR